VACECSFVFSCRDIFPALIKNVFNNPRAAKRLPFLIKIFEDCSYLKNALHLSKKDALFDWFKRDILNIINEELIGNTRTAIEDFVRLNIHTMLIEKIHGQNPYQREGKEINRILNVGRLEIFGEEIDLRDEIT
jgi:WASH complex subunit 7